MSTPILAPNSTWFRPDNTSITRSSITEINIVNSYTPTGSEIASWDASAANDGSVMCYVNGTKLTIAGNGSGKVFANADSSYAFSDSAKKDYYSALTTITGGDLLNTGNATTMGRMFQRCTSLKALDVSNWDTSSCTAMNAMFNNCTSLKTLDVSNWETGNVTAMAGMFNDCNVLTSLDVSGWKVNNVTTMNGMFQRCTSLKALDVSGWDVGKVTTMKSMFYNCTSLATLDVSGWDVSKVTTMQGMFYNCTSLATLDVSNWDTSSCTDMSFMFCGCTSLTTLDVSGWDTSSCTDMSFMFYGCTSLATLDVSGWDVSKVTAMQGMFSCGNDYGRTPMVIKTLDVSNWDTSSATDMSFMFYGCQGPGSIDVSGWDVSKVKTFDHMFAHSYLDIGDTSEWNVSTACTILNGLFHTVQNTTLDVSGFDTSKVTTFEQMFENCTKLTEIVGLEKFNTSSGLGFSEMFYNCSSLAELNLSSFDTRKAKDGATSSSNGSLTATLKDMFLGMNKLEKVTLGANFSFNGDGTTTVPENVGVLPTPDGAYIPGADGYWYTQHREKYLPADIQSQTAMTYYASLTIVNNIDFLVKNGSLLNIADKIRVLKDISQSMSLDDMEAQLDIPKNDSSDLTASGATVTVPIGYYAAQATKSIPTATQATPSISIDSAGKITASATQTAGYVSAGTKTSTHQLAFQPAKTITPTTASQIAVSSGYYTGGNVTVAGDSNLLAGNIKSGVSIFGVNGTLVAGGGSGGDTSVEDSLVTRTLTSYTNDRVTTIGSYAFYSCSNLTTANFPAAITIGNSVFYGCSNLTTVNFPACIGIGNSAFRNCYRLTTASFPVATTIGSSAFGYCYRLTTVSFPVATTIGSSAFGYCSRLTTASFPAATTIGNYAFVHCYKLSQLYLTGSSVCTLSNSNAFSSTPYAGYKTYFSGTPYIYVPQPLVESYKTATNWTYFSKYFSAI